MTFELNKFYKTKNGSKAKFEGIMNFPKTEWGTYKFVTMEGLHALAFYTDANGVHSLTLTHNLDVVAEWEEGDVATVKYAPTQTKRKVTHYVVYLGGENPTRHFYDGLEDAELASQASPHPLNQIIKLTGEYTIK